MNRSLASILAPLVLALGIVLSLASWYLEPGRRGVAVASLLLILGMTAAFALVARRPRRGVTRHVAADDITKAVAFAASTVVLALTGSLARTTGVVEDPDLARRATMMILGALLLVIGNGLPKSLTPLAALQCDGARLQAFQRLTGWTWALTGLAMIVIWAALPIAAARPVTLMLLVASMLIVARRLASLLATHRTTA